MKKWRFKILLIALLCFVASISLVSCGEPNKFMVSFNTFDGSEVASVEVVENEKITKPTKPIKLGYDFGGWYKDSATNIAWNFENDVVTENITLYAKWTQSRFLIELPNSSLQTNGYLVNFEEIFTNQVLYMGETKIVVTIDNKFSASNFAIKANDSVLVSTNSEPCLGGVKYYYTISNISANTVVTVSNVNINTYTITATNSDLFNLVGITNTSNKVQYGESFEFRIDLNNGYENSNIVVKNSTTNEVLEKSQNKTYTVANITQNTVISVTNITANTYSVTLPESSNNAYTLVNANASATYNSNYYLTVRLGLAYSQTDISDKLSVQIDGQQVAYTCSKSVNDYTFTILGGVILDDITIVLNSNNWIKNTYTITLPSNPIGYSINVVNKTISNNDFSILHGEDFRVNIAINNDYSNSNFKIYYDGLNVTSAFEYNSTNKIYSCNFTEISGNHTINVTNVEMNSYSVTFTNAEGVTVTDNLEYSRPIYINKNTYKFNLAIKLGYELSDSAMEVQYRINEGAWQDVQSTGTPTNRDCVINNINNNIEIKVLNVIQSLYTVVFPESTASYTISNKSATEVHYNDSLSFKLTLNSAYSQCIEQVVAKINNEVLSKTINNGVITFSKENITSSISQIDILNVQLNTYRVALCNGLGYLVAGTNTVLHGGAYSFTITLTEAYSLNNPVVKYTINEVEYICISERNNLVITYSVPAERITENIAFVLSSPILKNSYSVVFSTVNNLICGSFQNYPVGANYTNNSYTALVFHGANATPPTISPTPSANYKFVGWQDYTNINQAKIILALYSPIDYELSFELNDGTNNEENIDEGKSTKQFNIENLIELQNPTKYGYTFAGWFEDENFETAFNNTIMQSRTIYAKWVIVVGNTNSNFLSLSSAVSNSVSGDIILINGETVLENNNCVISHNLTIIGTENSVIELQNNSGVQTLEYNNIVSYIRINSLDNYNQISNTNKICVNISNVTFNINGYSLTAISINSANVNLTNVNITNTLNGVFVAGDENVEFNYSNSNITNIISQGKGIIIEGKVDNGLNISINNVQFLISEDVTNVVGIVVNNNIENTVIPNLNITNCTFANLEEEIKNINSNYAVVLNNVDNSFTIVNSNINGNFWKEGIVINNLQLNLLEAENVTAINNKFITNEFLGEFNNLEYVGFAITINNENVCLGITIFELHINENFYIANNITQFNNVNNTSNNIALNFDSQILEGDTFTVINNTKFTVLKTLEVLGTLVNNGTLINNGKIINNGTITNNGNVEYSDEVLKLGIDTFETNIISEMLVVEDEGNRSFTISGKVVKVAEDNTTVLNMFGETTKAFVNFKIYYGVEFAHQSVLITLQNTNGLLYSNGTHTRTVEDIVTNNGYLEFIIDTNNANITQLIISFGELSYTINFENLEIFEPLTVAEFVSNLTDNVQLNNSYLEIELTNSELNSYTHTITGMVNKNTDEYFNTLFSTNSDYYVALLLYVGKEYANYNVNIEFTHNGGILYPNGTNTCTTEALIDNNGNVLIIVDLNVVNDVVKLVSLIAEIEVPNCKTITHTINFSNIIINLSQVYSSLIIKGNNNNYGVINDYILITKDYSKLNTYTVTGSVIEVLDDAEVVTLFGANTTKKFVTFRAFVGLEYINQTINVSLENTGGLTYSNGTHLKVTTDQISNNGYLEFIIDTNNCEITKLIIAFWFNEEDVTEYTINFQNLQNYVISNLERFSNTANNYGIIKTYLNTSKSVEYNDVAKEYNINATVTGNVKKSLTNAVVNTMLINSSGYYYSFGILVGKEYCGKTATNIIMSATGSTKYMCVNKTVGESGIIDFIIDTNVVEKNVLITEFLASFTIYGINYDIAITFDSLTLHTAYVNSIYVSPNYVMLYYGEVQDIRITEYEYENFEDIPQNTETIDNRSYLISGTISQVEDLDATILGMYDELDSPYYISFGVYVDVNEANESVLVTTSNLGGVQSGLDNSTTTKTIQQNGCIEITANANVNAGQVGLQKLTVSFSLVNSQNVTITYNYIMFIDVEIV